MRACACVCARVCVHLCARQRQGGGETSIADWSSGTTAVRTTESWHRGPTAAACSTHILHACPCCSTVARTARRRRTSLCRRQVAVSRAADVGPDNPHTRARAHRLHVICSYCGVVVRATLRVMRRQLRKIVPQTHARTRTHARVHRSTSVHFGVDGPPRCLGTALVGVHAGGGTVTHSQHADSNTHLSVWPHCSSTHSRRYCGGPWGLCGTCACCGGTVVPRARKHGEGRTGYRLRAQTT